MNYTYDGNNKMLTAGGDGYTYDANGNTIARTGSSGNASWSYDYENRTITSSTPQGSASFVYNGDGLRVQKTEGGVATKYLLDGVRVYSEHDATMAEQARFMVEGSSYYSPLTAVRVGGACYYPLYDKLGSSRRLIDANQTVTDAYWYDAFGNITSQSGGTYNPYRYVGSLGYYSADTTTGLLHVGARYYSPQVGRFWTQDPLDVESNRYAYVLNDPLLLVDPAGLAAACWNPIIALSDPQCTLHWVFTRETWSEALIQSAYLGCYASCMGIPLSLKSLEELYTRGGGPRLTARALYHFTDRRFVAWGKYSRVLVPRLAGRILPWAEALSGVGSVVIAVESVRCMSKCTRCPR